jgi:hypothetical protein
MHTGVANQKERKIGGLSADLFVGRQVRFRTMEDRQHMMPAKLTELASGKAFVHPVGHKGVIAVPIESIAPWWSRNPDLQAMRDAQRQARFKTDSNNNHRPEPEPMPILPHSPIVEPPPVPAAKVDQPPAQFTPVAAPVTPKPAAKLKLPAFMVEPGADLQGAIPLLSSYQIALADENAALELLESARQSLGLLRDELRNMGFVMDLDAGKTVRSKTSSVEEPSVEKPLVAKPKPNYSGRKKGRKSLEDKAQLRRTFGEWFSATAAGPEHGKKWRIPQLAAKLNITTDTLRLLLIAEDPEESRHKVIRSSKPHVVSVY